MYPAARVQSIIWYFDSGTGAIPVSTSDTNVRTMSETGTSVLVLDNVGLGREGSYHCQVTLDGGEGPLISEDGFLVLNGEFVTLFSR